MSAPADIGLVGLAPMGRNLVLNLADHGYRVAVQNRTTARTEAFVTGPAAGADVVATETVEELAGQLGRPRIVMIMVKAGPAVDAVVESLVPHLSPGDVVMDGGNSLYTDTARRVRTLAERGIHFVGVGISGGEEGARHGPSIMPGGAPEAWPVVKDILQGIAATVADGTPCCDWLGPDGAGHFVKMVHNGIEYADMALIAEAYALMGAAGMSNGEMAEVFRSWNRGPLDSYLIEITAEILSFTDPERHDEPTIDVILDAAEQKGTGRWTAIASLELGQPLTLVAEAVYARVLSSLPEQRRRASDQLAGPDRRLAGGHLDVDDLGDALYASKIVSYAQGFMLLRAASTESAWDLDLGRIALLWRQGCIIRAAFLDDIAGAFSADPRLENLLLSDPFRSAVAAAQDGWRRTVCAGVRAGVAIPAYSSALAFYDGYRTERLPANLIQAQRDYFGAHTYERVDRERGETFHTQWHTRRNGGRTAGERRANVRGGPLEGKQTSPTRVERQQSVPGAASARPPNYRAPR